MAVVLLFVLGSQIFFADKARGQEPELITKGGSRVSKVAPGESLPVNVKMMNFGIGERVDVTIHYKVLNNENRIMIHETETVAVETTASYERDVLIPEDFPSGRYTVQSEIEYDGQMVPAVSQFQFSVENKLLGFFLSDLIFYSVVVVVTIGVVLFLIHLVARGRRNRLDPPEYSDVNRKERIFYEIISDMIMQMRYKEGERAVMLAQGIEGLDIDQDSCKVLKIEKDPVEIITLLMIKYEKTFGRKGAEKISQKVKKKTRGKDKSLDKNLKMIKKYFSKLNT